MICHVLLERKRNIGQQGMNWEVTFNTTINMSNGQFTWDNKPSENKLHIRGSDKIIESFKNTPPTVKPQPKENVSIQSQLEYLNCG